MARSKNLRLPALEIQQGKGRKLYSFAVEGKRIHEFADITRLSRSEKKVLTGYQRPEVLSHIAEIRSYIESPDALIPNALVVAFDRRVKFSPAKGARSTVGGSRHGTLEIPVNGSEEKAGFIVDGQQRAAALRDADVDSFPICVTAFVAETEAEQREQFILVNSTKPLPKGLLYELLPATKAKLPTLLNRRRFPAQVLERLNHDRQSPFRGMIQTPTNPEGVIKDNSILKMLENSLTDGALYHFRSGKRRRPDVTGMIRLLAAFWSAVADVFPDAWGQPPRKSRLMHGVGIVSMGFVMDAISDRYWMRKEPSMADFTRNLKPLCEVCRWTSGYWDFGPEQIRKWNELQNTSKDIQLLANHLLMQYKDRVWKRGRAARTASRS